MASNQNIRKARQTLVLIPALCFIAIVGLDNSPTPLVEAQVRKVPQKAEQTAPKRFKTQEKLDFKRQWLKKAGIPRSDWMPAIKLIQAESSWRPEAINPSSGACGLAQTWPCSKFDNGDWSDPIRSLEWAHRYVHDRYGGWAEAWHFWQYEAPDYNGNNWY